jgi:DNA invertase Pin-like site-specific DNA recombinase
VNQNSLEKRCIRIFSSSGDGTEEYAPEAVKKGLTAQFTRRVIGKPLTAVAQFERDLIKERQRDGIALAKQRGAYTGRKKALSEEKVTELRRRTASGEKKAHLAREFGISRETVYQYLRHGAK